MSLLKYYGLSFNVGDYALLDRLKSAGVKCKRQAGILVIVFVFLIAYWLPSQSFAIEFSTESSFSFQSEGIQVFITNKEPSEESENKRKDYQERIGNFEFKTQERRPEFGSLLAAMAAIFLGIAAIGNGGLRGWRMLLGLAGILLIFDGTFGFLFGFDFWCLGERFFG